MLACFARFGSQSHPRLKILDPPMAKVKSAITEEPRFAVLHDLWRIGDAPYAAILSVSDRSICKPATREHDTSGSRFYQLTSRASRSVIISDETFATSVSQKSEPLNILQQQPQICSDLNKILHTQDNICYKHYYIVSYKSALTLLKYEFLNNTAHKS